MSGAVGFQGAQGAQGAPGAAESLAGTKTVPYVHGSEATQFFLGGESHWLAYTQASFDQPGSSTFDSSAFVVNQPASVLTSLHVYIDVTGTTTGDVPLTVSVWRQTLGQPVVEQVPGYEVTIGLTLPHYRSVGSRPGLTSFAPAVPLQPGDRLALLVQNRSQDQSVFIRGVSASITI